MIRTLCLVFACWVARGQTPAFEVASIKASAPMTGGPMRMGMSRDKGMVTISNLTLKSLAAQAYRVKQSQITAPEWMSNQRFDIVAKLPEGASMQQIPEMLQSLLADRFKMTVHKESKVMPIYALEISRNGSKLKDAEAATGLRVMMTPKGYQASGGAPLSQLADLLSSNMDRPVMDMTELKGTYQIDLAWLPDERDGGGGMMRMPGPGPGPGPRPEGAGEPKVSDMADAPSLFIALQEKMGLKLEARKSPIDMIVVDHAEKTPTEN